MKGWAVAIVGEENPGWVSSKHSKRTALRDLILHIQSLRARVSQGNLLSAQVLVGLGSDTSNLSANMQIEIVISAPHFPVHHQCTHKRLELAA
jgi:hypothetical protein